MPGDGEFCLKMISCVVCQTSSLRNDYGFSNLFVVKHNSHNQAELIRMVTVVKCSCSPGFLGRARLQAMQRFLPWHRFRTVTWKLHAAGNDPVGRLANVSLVQSMSWCKYVHMHSIV